MGLKINCADAVTLVSGKMVIPSVTRVYELLNFLTGETLYTHQLPRAAHAAEPHVRAAMPKVAKWCDKNARHITTSNWQAMLKKAVASCGDEFEITPLPPGAYEVKHPIAEAVEMVGPERVVVLDGRKVTGGNAEMRDIVEKAVHKVDQKEPN